jgi:hypothetical protein
LLPPHVEVLKARCANLRAKHPQDFTVTPAQARGRRLGTCCSMAVKREEPIGQCLKEGNLAAAFFHRNWLIAEMVLNAGKT